jgi:hypothetical protein
MREANSSGEKKMRRKYVVIKPTLQYLPQIYGFGQFKISSLKLIIVKNCVPNPDPAGLVIVRLQDPFANSTFSVNT